LGFGKRARAIPTFYFILSSVLQHCLIGRRKYALSAFATAEYLPCYLIARRIRSISSFGRGPVDSPS
jgi:hypothetical protein